MFLPSVRSCARFRATSAAAALVYLLLLIAPLPTAAQPGGFSSVSAFTVRPFVVGLIPVVGPRGGVGGVSIDAQGVVTRTEIDALGKLREARLRALEGAGQSPLAASPLRKISLRRLQVTIDDLRRQGRPVSAELQNVAGLVRVQVVLVYPEHRDIVLAGPAEGWTVDAQVNVVGQTSGQPVLQLDDLIVALRSANAARVGEGITCSIDPTEEGIKRWQRLVSMRGLEMNESTIARMEQALGPQHITVTGVPPESRFAQVLVASDFTLKRLGMGLEPAPISGMPSYMEMLQASSAPAPRGAMPRFWMAPHYESLLKDADGLAWQLRGSGVKTLAEDTGPGSRGSLTARRGNENSLAARWAAGMTDKFESLSAALPVFAELRNCMDLAVIAALLVKEDLPGRAGCDISLLLDNKQIQVAEYHVPKSVDSRASVIRKGRAWVVGVSGGVEVDSWSVLNQVAPQPKLADIRTNAAPQDSSRWWWD